MTKLSTTTAVTYVGLYWVVFGALAFVSALGGVFTPALFFFYLFAGGIALSSARAEALRRALVPLAPALGIVLTGVLVWSIFTTPTIFTGRDQGSIATAAVMLAESHALSTHTPISDAFFGYYGEGRALNFPGFFYTADGALTPQFPIPYIAYLAVFYSIFGVYGFTLANAILFVLFALSFVVLVQHLAAHVTRKKSARIGSRHLALTFLLTSFPLMWFFKHTLSENLAQFLIFFMLLQAVLFVHHAHNSLSRARLHFWTALLTGALLTFTRIEGIVLVAFLLFAFLLHPRTFAYLRTRLVSHLFAPAVGLLFALALVFAQTPNFYKSIAKALLPSGDAGGASASFFSNLIARYTEYLSYGILPFLFVGAYGVYTLWRTGRYTALLPAFVTAPLVVYLIDPHISSDAPWMLRRMSFALLPIGMLYSILFILRSSRRTMTLLTVGLIALSLPAYATFLPFSENRQLLQQTQALGAQFTRDDALLVDASVSGNGFALLSGPLRAREHKNAAYIFNPADLTRVDFSAFRDVFLITSADAARRYTDALGQRLAQRAHLTMTTTRLMHPPYTALWRFPTRDTVTTPIVIFHVRH